MSFEAAKLLLLRVVRAPAEPSPPEGSAESLRVFRASPQYWSYRLVIWAVSQAWLIVGAIVGVGVLQAALERGEVAGLLRQVFLLLEVVGLVGVVGSIGVSYVALRLDYEMRWYMVTDRSLRIREGVWHVHEMTMTFANIQNITISQGPLQRLLGIADLRVQSAGGGGLQPGEGRHGQGIQRDLHVGYFRGVDEAPAIRDLILQRLRLLRDAGLGDHDDQHHAEPLPPAPDARSERRRAPGLSRLVPLLEQLRDEASRLRRAAANSGRGARA